MPGGTPLEIPEVAQEEIPLSTPEQFHIAEFPGE